MLSVRNIDGTDCISQGILSTKHKQVTTCMMFVISVCSWNHSKLSVYNIDGTDWISHGMILLIHALNQLMLSVCYINGTDCISQGILSTKHKQVTTCMMLVISVCSSNHSKISVYNIDGSIMVLTEFTGNDSLKHKQVNIMILKLQLEAVLLQHDACNLSVLIKSFNAICL